MRGGRNVVNLHGGGPSRQEIQRYFDGWPQITEETVNYRVYLTSCFGNYSVTVCDLMNIGPTTNLYVKYTLGLMERF